MRIAFFGSSLVSAYWNGAATYYRGILKALHQLGYAITFFEPDAYDRQKHRDLKDVPYATDVVYAPKVPAVKTCLWRAREYDIVVKASGIGVFDQMLEKEILTLKAPNRKVIFWDVDAPATLRRIAADPDDPFRPLIGEYDMILTYGGGAPVVQAYTRFGARLCVPVYNALDAATHYPVAPQPRFRADLSFLGNRMPDRESRVREFFFKTVEQLPHKQFILGGSGWEYNRPALPNLRYVGHVYTADHNAFNVSPTAILNISRQDMADYGFSPATRVFEAAGAGACVITDQWEGLEMFLQPQTECIAVGSGEELVDLLSYLTAEQAARIGRAARRRVLSEHTYEHRARQLNRLLTTQRTNARDSVSPAGRTEASLSL
jgi:spore maturation protein CgeB